MAEAMTEEFPGMPRVGDIAPDVVLPDDTGTQRSLSDERGKWVVLYFYPKDDTSGCTTEACQFRDINSDINARDAEVWGVSILGSGSKAAFKAKFGLPFVLLADETRQSPSDTERGSRSRTTGASTWASSACNVPGRSGREGSSRSGPTVKADGHAAEVLAALDESEARSEPAALMHNDNEASPVGGDERCLCRSIHIR